MSDVWGNYWEKGHSTTFGEYYSDGYTRGYIAEWIKQIVKSHSGKQRSILEVGCGNASLLPCLYDLNVTGNYVGIDAAKIQISASAIKRQKDTLKVDILSETPVEEFKTDQNFDLILSIYGIEYSEVDYSLPILKNCLSAKGNIFLLMHYADSYIYSKSQQAIKEFDFKTMEKVIAKLNTVNNELNKFDGNPKKLSQSKKAEKSREFLNRFISKIMSESPNQRNPIMVDFCQKILLFFKKIRDSKLERKNHIDSIMPDFVASKERFLQMVNVAKNKKEMDIFKTKMEASGFKNVIINPVEIERGPVAWSVQAD